MSSAEEMSLVTSQPTVNSQLHFQQDSVRFPCGPPQRRVTGDPGPKTRELSSYIDDKLFSTNNTQQDRYFHAPHHEFPRFRQENRDWNDGSSGDDDDSDDDVDDDDDDVDDRVRGGNGQSDKSNSNNAISGDNNGADLEKMGNGQQKNHSNFGNFIQFWNWVVFLQKM